MIKTFVVNLAHSTERKKYMETLLKEVSIEYEFFPAVYGKEIKNLDEVYDKEKAQRFHKAALKRGELGCALSHLKIYKKMIDQHIERALILEDDVLLKKDFYPVLSELQKIPMNNDVFMLGHSGAFIRKKLFGKKIMSCYCLKQIKNSGRGTFGYMIDLQAAKRLYTFNFPVKCTADDWYIFSSFINIYIVEPVVADYEREDSYSIIDEIDNRALNRPSLYLQLKKSSSLCCFINLCLQEFLRITKGALRRISWFVELFVFSVLPEKRIE